MPALLSFGMFVFSIPTLAYSELQRSTDFRHARSNRVGARDATQFVGVGDETISLDGTAVAELQDGEASLDELRALGGKGEAWPLVCASGRSYGTFVLTRLNEKSKAFFPDGTPRAIDFGIDLLRVDDPDRTAR